MATKDAVLVSALHGTAWRCAVEERALGASIADLREIAGGRNDILAEAAGLTVGSWFARPQMHTGVELMVAGMLIMAGDGLDYDLLAHWARVGFERGIEGRGALHGPALGNGIN